MDVEMAIALLIFVLPAYVANAVPVVLGGGTPMDFGKNFPDGRRVFGDGKTVRGFLAGVFGGAVAGAALSAYVLLPFFSDLRTQFVALALTGLGAMAGDALGSFLKRRLGVEPGKPFILDQLMFLVMALAFAYPFASADAYEPVGLLFLFTVTYVLHIGSNWVANRLGWKKVPW